MRFTDNDNVDQHCQHLPSVNYVSWQRGQKAIQKEEYQKMASLDPGGNVANNLPPNF